MENYKSPVYNVFAVPIEKVVANAYNPNTVAPPEMKLLELSIWEDGYTMPCVLNEPLRQIAAHTVGGGVGVVPFRMFFLKLLKALHQYVKVVIGNSRGVVHIIAVVVPLYFPAQTCDFIVYFFCVHRWMLCLRVQR